MLPPRNFLILYLTVFVQFNAQYLSAEALTRRVPFAISRGYCGAPANYPIGAINLFNPTDIEQKIRIKAKFRYQDTYGNWKVKDQSVETTIGANSFIGWPIPTDSDSTQGCTAGVHYSGTVEALQKEGHLIDTPGLTTIYQMEQLTLNMTRT